MSLAQKEIEQELKKLLEGMTGDELVEIGIGIIGRGTYRAIKDEGNTHAAELLGACASTLTDMRRDLLRAAVTEANAKKG